MQPGFLLNAQSWIKAILLANGPWIDVKGESLRLLGDKVTPEQLIWQTDDGSWITCRTTAVQALALKKTFRKTFAKAS